MRSKRGESMETERDFDMLPQGSLSRRQLLLWALALGLAMPVSRALDVPLYALAGSAVRKNVRDVLASGERLEGGENPFIIRHRNQAAKLIHWRDGEIS